MAREATPKTLWDALRAIPDPRGRRGQRYRLPTLLGLLFVAALAGETTLRGMVQWIHALIRDWMARYPEPLDLWSIPSYNAFYYALRKLGPAPIAQALEAWFRTLNLPANLLEREPPEGRDRVQQAVAILVKGARTLQELGWAPEDRAEDASLVEILWRQPGKGAARAEGRTSHP